MHPALSVIVFTVASGAGFGLLAWLGVLAGLGRLSPEPSQGALGLGTAFVLASGGLIASTWHLGHPERAWRALSQWRSSWLSREGVAALATYVPAAILGWGWIGLATLDGVFRAAAFASAALAIATVAATGMIYASLKPIAAWRNPWVVPGYLANAAASGALVSSALVAPLPLAATVALALAWGIKAAYWRSVGPAEVAGTRERATSLGFLGRVRPLDPPHSGANYLLREMGFRIARKHARRLRRFAHALAYASPIGLTLLSWAGPAWLGAPCRALAVGACAAGLLVERWLFFAEARHSVTLYYPEGAGRA
jgi:DMSO reductase anchor subunit